MASAQESLARGEVIETVALDGMGTPRLSTQILDNRDVLDAVPQMAERSEGSERSRRERKLNTKYTDEDFVGEGSSRGGIHATNNTSHSSQAVCRFAGSGRQKQKVSYCALSTHIVMLSRHVHRLHVTSRAHADVGADSRYGGGDLYLGSG